MERKHPTFAVSLHKNHKFNDEKRFPNRDKVTIEPPIERNSEKKIFKILDSRMVRKHGKDIKEFLWRFKDRPAYEDEWRAPPDIPDSDRL